MAVWQFQEAKAKLSEVARRAKSEGPQIITIHGKEEVVLLSKKDYDATRPRRSVWEQLAPLRGSLGDIELPDFTALRKEDPVKPPFWADWDDE